MAKWTLGSYNRFLGAAMTRHGLTRKQAAEMYREARDKSGSPVFRTYLDKHPRISKRLAERSILRRPPIEKPKRPPEREYLPTREELLEIQEELDDDLGIKLIDQEAESSEDYEEAYQGKLAAIICTMEDCIAGTGKTIK
jgi:hypothetical protein